MKIAIDAFGGDLAPLEMLKGAAAARREFREEIALTGDVEAIKSCAADNGVDIGGIELIPAASVMDMHDEARLVVKGKRDSSMGVGLSLVADGAADAFVSAGPTGALLMGATMIVKRIKGVKRPALGAVLPTLSSSALLIDCGANVECRPDMLDQFGLMGSLYMKLVIGKENPLVGLANNGAEDSKGTELQKDAYRLLKANADVNFFGNIEGRDIPYGTCDVVVTDGFTGNLVLKTLEGMGSVISKKLKAAMMKNALTKLSAVLLRPTLKAFSESMDYAAFGGAPFIGLTRPVIKAHGSSGERAIKNAIRQAINWSRAGVTEAIEAKLRGSTQDL